MRIIKGSTAFVVLAAVLSACGALKTPEQRMKEGCAGASVRSAVSILDLSAGMTAEEAIKTLKCYDSSADVQSGWAGEFYNEVNKLLKELDPAGSGYGNLLIWTRGKERPCTGSTAGSGELAEASKSDDQRFASIVVSGADGKTNFKCFATIKDQIVLRLGGPPDAQVVTGLWRLTLPDDGSRPMITDLARSLVAKYPALTMPEGDFSNGFWGSGFLDQAGNALNASQISEDYKSLRPPVAPTPPDLTEPCGFLWTERCPRDPTQGEVSAYDSAKAKYDEDLKTYEPRHALAQRFGPCVTSAPRDPGNATVDDGQNSSCGASFFVAVSPYPGGYAEGIFVGIYDPTIARNARVKLDGYLRTRTNRASPEKPDGRSPAL